VSTAAIAAVSMTGCVATTGSSGGAGTVIAYNTPKEWANWGEVLKQFTAKTGIAAANDPKNSGQTLAALTAEASAPVADVAYFGLVFGLQADQKGLLEPYSPPLIDQVPKQLKADNGTWSTVHQGAIAMLVNTKAIGNAPVPKCWKDLTKPEYKNLVGFLDPTSAAVGYSVLAAANLSLGGSFDNWDPGISWAKKMKDNGLALPKQTATSAVQQGEIPILIDADFNGYKLANVDKAPIKVVLPCEGTISVPYVMGLVKGAPHPEQGKKLLDFALSDAGQKLFAQSYLRPVRSEVKLPDDIAAAMTPVDEYQKLVKAPDFKAMNDSMNKALALWTSEVTG